MDRIETGFHRLGIVLAAPCVLMVVWYFYLSAISAPRDILKLGEVAFAWVVWANLAYYSARTIGWIITWLSNGKLASLLTLVRPSRR